MKKKNSDKLIKGLEFLGGERTPKSGFQTLYPAGCWWTPAPAHRPRQNWP